MSKFVKRQAGVGHIAEGVAEGDHLCGILLEAVVSDLLPVSHEDLQVVKCGNFRDNGTNVGWVEMAFLANEIRGSLSLVTGAVIDGLTVEVILVAAEPPVADVVFIQVPGRLAEPFDDGFIRDAVVEHLVDLVAEFGGQAGDFAVSAGFGLASAEFAAELVIGIGKEGGHGEWMME